MIPARPPLPTLATDWLSSHEHRHLHRGPARRSPAARFPRPFFDYAETGSYAQETLRANREDLERIRLRQRVLVDVSGRDLTTTIIGEKVNLPLVLAPIGMCGMMHGDGEILACRAAQAAGIPFTLSTMSICSIEDVAGAVDKPFWFQLYVVKDRGFIKALIERAAAAKCSALVVTLDLQILGQRHCDIRNGMTVPPRHDAAQSHRHRHQAGLGAERAQGQAQDLGQSRRSHPGHGRRALALAWTAGQFDPTLNWKDIEWIRSIWPGKMILKGILDVEDAKMAAQARAPRRSSCPTTAAGSSTARRRPSRRCRRSSRRSAATSRC